MNEFLLILGMALVTFIVRYPVLALVGKFTLPDRVVQALRYVPSAVLAAIILPELLLPTGDKLSLSIENTRLIAALIAALVAWRTKNLLLTIVVGMVTLWVWGWLITGN